MNISRQPPETKHFTGATEELTATPQHRFLLYSTFSLAGNMEEANKLIGLGKKHLVMGKVVEAVNTLQEACSMLAKKYGDTADECGEAFYWCGKALLDLARMENSVLGNALQGVPEEDEEEEEEEEEEKPKDSNMEMESTENLDDKTRDELRVQVYDAMSEKEEQKVSDEKDASTAEKASDEKDASTAEKASDEKDASTAEKASDEKDASTTEKASDEKDASTTEKASDEKDASTTEKASDEKDASTTEKASDEKDASTTEKASDEKDASTTEKAEDAKEKIDNISEMKDGATEKEPTTAEKLDVPSATEKAEEKKAVSPIKDDLGKDAKVEDKTTEGKKIESDENNANVIGKMEKDAEETENEEAEEDGEADGDDEDDDKEAEEMEDDEKAEGEDTAEKGSDDEEVGNLQLAWEMLEVAKVIYKRKEAKEDQLMAAQTHLKLGEVSAESGNYTQAVEDFQECLKLQLKHLESDSRLLAETHYQLGLTYSLNCQYKQAIDELNSSISVIKSRIENIQKLIDKAEGPDALPEERKEMDELKALLPEIQEKIEDATEGLKTASTDAEAVKDVLDGNTAPEAGDKLISTKANDIQSEQTTASDISHLVRKKRKPEDSPVKEVKKVKQDDAQTNSTEEPQTNEVHTNGRNNGHSDSMEVESN
ncbi:histone-binding protein N1/N2-like [Periophthalmus magnuspinnatus]|uniref:histone-binding protein N1/N2-like n=1 Tax=Periophthalmus magnuspinnatus TaxID=409849 RepID=UPI0024363C9A|nr:histone-binding protein N1/N2-like [Periophthalmus magnuspinnatus]